MYAFKAKPTFGKSTLKIINGRISHTPSFVEGKFITENFVNLLAFIKPSTRCIKFVTPWDVEEPIKYI